VKAIVLHFRAWRIRKAQERVAYWKAKADMWHRLCSGGQHMSYERDAWVEAVAEHARHEARLASLQNAGNEARHE
jgi:hypothetical protein